MSGKIEGIEVVFFDLGFTLINFEGNFKQAMSESYLTLANSLIASGCTFDKSAFAKKYCENITNYYHIRDVDLIERPVEESLRKTLEHFGVESLSTSVLNQAIEDMFTSTEAYWQIEADTHSTLTELRKKGYRLAIISNASNTPDINRLIDKHNLRGYFEQIVISAEEKIRKPDSRIYQRALTRMNVEARHAMMVGDTLTADIMGAKQMDILSVWIRRRADRPENTLTLERIKPDYTISDLRSLINLL